MYTLFFVFGMLPYRLLPLHHGLLPYRCGARGGKPQKTIQSPNKLHKAPTDSTKPQNTTQRPNILHIFQGKSKSKQTNNKLDISQMCFECQRRSESNADEQI